MTYRLLGSIIFFLFWFVYIFKDRFKVKLLKTAIVLTLFAILFMKSEYNRYELTTTFYQPCWSPDGKQIAFFMVRDDTRYRPGMLGYIPTHIWQKSYLCTMDYDGRNFKQIKQTEQATDEISWSGSREIVYTQLVMQDINTVLQSKILATSTDGNETGILFETAKIPTKESIKGTERILDPWLSKDKRYLGFVLNYREPKKTNEEDIRLGRYYDNYELIVKDLRTQQTKIDILQRDVKSLRYREFYGAYNMSKVAYYNNDILEICDLGNNEIIKIDMLKFKQDGYLPSFSTWDLSGTYLLGMKDKFDIEKRELIRQNNNWYLNTGVVAPNGEMKADAGALGSNDSTIFIYRENSKDRPITYSLYKKCSYLFNIFGK